MAFKKRRYWDNQPQEAVDLASEGLGAGIFASIDGQIAHANGSAVVAGTGSTLAPLAATPAGLGSNTNGGINDRRILVDGPTAVAAPWSFAATLQPFGNVSLSHIVGFNCIYSGNEIDGGAGRDQKVRGLLNYLNNYYFWGGSTDWNTGIAFDTDGLVHTVMVTHDGSTLRFYRDGVLRGSTARNHTSASTSGGYFVIGNEHSSGAASPNARIISGRGWNRCLSAGDAANYAANPNAVYADQTIPVPVSAGGGTVTLAAQDAAHAHALDNAALSIGVTLTVADLAHGHALDASTLSTGTAVAVADSLHAHALDNVTLSTTGAVSLTVADSLHAHTLDAVVLTSQTDLAAADMAHGHALDGVTLTLGGVNLVIADIMHAHALDNVALTLDTYLAVADLLHAHTLDNVLVSIPGGTLDLILKILVNRQELNPATGTFTLYDDDGVTVLYTTSAWADAAGTVPYSGGALRRIDALF